MVGQAPVAQPRGHYQSPIDGTNENRKLSVVAMNVSRIEGSKSI